jgi:putative hemolysin
MPSIMTELGRLREETFRDVGEGTNRSIDIDEFDLYYWQLFIWDEEEKRIVGAYRAGKGKEILDRYGVKGFYINSLFKIDEKFSYILEQSIELGRSFIVKEYQRKPLPLFLLWKGILYFLIKNPEYRYLIGPVSISNRFSSYSKGLIISFMKSNYYDQDFARFIKPRNMFRVPINKEDYDIIFNNCTDLSRLDNFIKDIEPEEFRMPVLLKKYVKLNGKIISFNVDPKFNDALDGLLILDLFQVPIDTITSLSKEINDKSLLERFNLSDYTFEKEEVN